MPFLLRYPEVQGENVRSVKTPINTPDILPTLLGLAGVAIPKTVEGEDLSGLVKGTAERPEKAALIMSVSPFAAGLKECSRNSSFLLMLAQTNRVGLRQQASRHLGISATAAAFPVNVAG